MNQEALQQSLPRIATLLIVVMAAALIGLRAYAFWRDYQTLDKEVSVKSSQVASAQKERPISSLVALNLFGRKIEKTEPEVQATEDLPETNLKLTLRGVSATEEDSIGGALVEGPDRQTEFFRIGDDMPGNATLHSVYANRVVIDRRGKLENLFFPVEYDNSAFEVYDSSRDSGDNYSEPPFEEPEYPEPQYVEPEYPEPQYAEPDYSGQPDPIDFTQPPVNAQPALDGMDEQRREEIRNRLQQLREQIRQQNNG
ncbi:type II secretion system protein N [Hahella ganghwensis]|uniref:type II secretion system protein N n=1 Tax=Hahella ganghwensis TaxID=286420 RepID=UPI000367E783|nr:type II secretion system protein N [Hahella ganghwensis]